MTRIFILLTVALIGFTGCKKARLDSLAFPSEKLDSYQFEKAEGEIEIPESMMADAAHYTLMTFNSHDESANINYKIYGVFIGDIGSIASDTLIVYFHGQSKHMDNYFSRASLLANCGGKYNYNILMMDYRGYGMSEGESSEQGLYEDADAVINYLINMGVDPNKTIYYGYSLGAIPAIDRLANRTDFQASKLIIESPLASVQNLVETSTVIQTDAEFMTDLKFENAEKIKSVTQPLQWFHGIEDTYIAIENGELIFANSPAGVKEANRIPGSDHSEIPVKIGLENYIQKVTSFIQE